MSKINLRWLIAVFWLCAIFFVLCILNLRDIARLWCAGAFLTAAGFFGKTEADFWVKNWTRAGMPVWARKQRLYSGLLMLFSGGLLIFSFFLVSPYIYSGFYALSFAAVLATKGVKFLRSKRNLPLILRRLASDGSIRNYIKAIDAFISANDFEKAIQYAEESISKHPKSSVLHAWLANAYECADKDDKAIPYAKKAMQIDPRSEFVRGSIRRLRNIGYRVEMGENGIEESDAEK